VEFLHGLQMTLICKPQIIDDHLCLLHEVVGDSVTQTMKDVMVQEHYYDAEFLLRQWPSGIVSKGNAQQFLGLFHIF